MKRSEIMHPADQICEVMKRIYDMGLTSMTGGNLSVMDSGGVMWMTPSGIDKGGLTREDIVRVMPDGTVQGRHKPTSEYRIHKRIYEIRPEMKAVVHAHAPGLVTMSILHKAPDTELMEDSCRIQAHPGLTEYATPGSMDLVEAVGAEFSKGKDFAVLKNHAAFCASSKDLWDAYLLFEQMEFASKVESVAAWLSSNDRMMEEAPVSGDVTQQKSGSPVSDDVTQQKSVSPVSDDATLQKSVSRPQLSYMQRGEMSSAERELRSRLARFSARAYRKGLFTGIGGVISARLGGNDFLISPKRRDNAEISPEDFVLVCGGSVEEGKEPAWEWYVHQAVYTAHPELNCIMLGLPVYASAWGLSRRYFPVEIAPEVYGVLRQNARMTREAYEDAETVSKALSGEKPFYLVENRGVLAAGPDIGLTFDKMEVAEFSAYALVMAMMRGGRIHPLSMEELLLTDIH